MRAFGFYRGDLIAGGSFTSIDGVDARGVARWDGSSWRGFGSGLPGEVLAVAVHHDDLYAAGNFAIPGAAPNVHIARWDGSSWLPLGTNPDGTVLTMASSDSDLLVGGEFTHAGGLASIGWARYGCPPCYPNCDRSTIQPSRDMAQNNTAIIAGRTIAGLGNRTSARRGDAVKYIA